MGAQKFYGQMFLTILSFVATGAVVYFSMHFITATLGLPTAYWLVPLLGSLGGSVGGLIRNDNNVILCGIDDSGRVHLGITGEIIFGIGGACAIVFLLGNNLQVDSTGKPLSYLLLISVSFIAGVFGKRIVELAGEKLLKQAEERAKVVAKAEAQAQILPSTYAVGNAFAATVSINNGDVADGLKFAEEALRYDPNSIHALLEKGRAFKLMGKIEEALGVVEEALRIKQTDARALYNRACYKCILKRDAQEILSDLRKAFESMPELRTHARTDKDLEAMRSLPEFTELIGASP